MKLIILLTFFATFCKLNFSHSIPADFSSFQNYRNVLAYILNQTKSIDDSILDEVDNLVGYVKEPDDYMKNIVEYLTESLNNQPQVPYFDEFGAEFYELSCQEIEEELKILYEVSKHFVMKAVKNEETIKMLKNLVSGLAKIGYDNYDLISNVIDTIADNYAAQNHVFMMINNLDDEIQEDIEMIAQYCRKGEYEVVEAVEEPKEDGWLDVIMDNGQDLLELIGVRNSEEDEPEFLVFEGNEDPEQLQIYDQVEDPIEILETEDSNIFGELEEPEDPNMNITSENLTPIIINLVIEPENPKNDDNLSKNQAENVETEEILEFLAENPEIAEFLLQEIKTEKEDAPDFETDKFGELEPETENETFTNYVDDSQKFNKMEINDKDSQDDDWLINIDNDKFDLENIEAENFETESSKSKNSKHDNIHEKGLIVNIPYPDEDSNNPVDNKQINEFGPQDVENREIIPEADNFMTVFPVENDGKLEEIIDIEDKSIKNEEFEPETKKNLNQGTFKDSVLNKHDNVKDKIFIKDSKLIEPKDENDEEFNKDSDLNKLEINKVEDFQKDSSMESNKDKDETKNKAIVNDWVTSEYGDELLANELQEIEKPKEFVDFEAENSDDKIENLENESFNFENLMKFPKNFWDVPFGFWQSLQNFVENVTDLKESDSRFKKIDKSSEESAQNIEDSSLVDQNYLKNDQKFFNEKTADDNDDEITNSGLSNIEALINSNKILKPEADESVKEKIKGNIGLKNIINYDFENENEYEDRNENENNIEGIQQNDIKFKKLTNVQKKKSLELQKQLIKELLEEHEENQIESEKLKNTNDYEFEGEVFDDESV